MNLNNKTRMLTESAIIVTITTIFIFLGLYLTPIILVLYPIPFVVLGIRHDIKASILTLFASFILVAILIDPVTSLFVTIIFGPLAIVLSFMINRNYSPYKIIIASSLVSFLSIVLTLVVTDYITGIRFYDILREQFNIILETQEAIFKEMEVSSYRLEELLDAFSTAIDNTILIFPAILIISSLFISYINYLISSAILKRLQYKNINIPLFSKFRLPSNIIIGIIVISIGSALISYYKLFAYDTIILNVAVLFVFLFFLQGLSVIVYLLNKTKINTILKALIIFFLILSSPLMIVISLFGLVDTLVDFRKPKEVK